MPLPSESVTIITNKFRIRDDSTSEFADWQAKLNAIIAAFPGFVSLEILSPSDSSVGEWSIVQRFHDPENTSAWQNSPERKALLDELRNFLIKGQEGFQQEIGSGKNDLHGNVTEVFVTQVSPDKEDAYRKWSAKMHQVEAKFPGFKGVYVQSPTQNQGKNWITLLQFDTPENLDRWLSSEERQQVLRESEPLIASLESHRVISPYAGWFASMAKKGEIPPVWKQTMIILLVLFPIVMLELKYLNPHLQMLNLSLATFIGNALSVTLISWPMMPIAIWFLSGWLNPRSTLRTTLLGTALMSGLYLIEIVFFWYFL